LPHLGQVLRRGGQRPVEGDLLLRARSRGLDGTLRPAQAFRLRRPMLAPHLCARRSLRPSHLAPHHDAGRAAEAPDEAEDRAEDDQLAPAEAELVVGPTQLASVSHAGHLTWTPGPRSPGVRARSGEPGPPPARARAGRASMRAPRAERCGTWACEC